LQLAGAACTDAISTEAVLYLEVKLKAVFVAETACQGRCRTTPRVYAVGDLARRGILIHVYIYKFPTAARSSSAVGGLKA